MPVLTEGEPAAAPSPPEQPASWFDALGSHVFDVVSGGATVKTPRAGPAMAVPVSHATNPEHEAEKAAEVAKQRKKMGVADWKFADGAAELQKSKPWYTTASSDAGPVDGVNPFGKAVEAAVYAARDERSVCLPICLSGLCTYGVERSELPACVLTLPARACVQGEGGSGSAHCGGAWVGRNGVTKGGPRTACTRGLLCAVPSPLLILIHLIQLLLLHNLLRPQAQAEAQASQQQTPQQTQQ